MTSLKININITKADLLAYFVGFIRDFRTELVDIIYNSNDYYFENEYMIRLKENYIEKHSKLEYYKLEKWLKNEYKPYTEDKFADNYISDEEFYNLEDDLDLSIVLPFAYNKLHFGRDSKLGDIGEDIDIMDSFKRNIFFEADSFYCSPNLTLDIDYANNDPYEQKEKFMNREDIFKPKSVRELFTIYFENIIENRLEIKVLYELGMVLPETLLLSKYLERCDEHKNTYIFITSQFDIKMPKLDAVILPMVNEFIDIYDNKKNLDFHHEKATIIQRQWCKTRYTGEYKIGRKYVDEGLAEIGAILD